MMTVETLEFLSAARRFIRAAGKRCAEADEIQLRELLGLYAELDDAVQVAVDGIRARGMSWDYIASATDTTRQAAFKRWRHR